MSQKTLHKNSIYPDDTLMKNLPASAGDAGDLGSVPGAGISSVGGTGNSLQDPHLGNPLDREAWKAMLHGSQRVGHN